MQNHTGTGVNAKAHAHLLQKGAVHAPRAGVDHLEDFCVTIWMA